MSRRSQLDPKISLKASKVSTRYTKMITCVPMFVQKKRRRNKFCLSGLVIDRKFEYCPPLISVISKDSGAKFVPETFGFESTRITRDQKILVACLLLLLKYRREAKVPFQQLFKTFKAVLKKYGFDEVVESSFVGEESHPLKTSRVRCCHHDDDDHYLSTIQSS